MTTGPPASGTGSHDDSGDSLAAVTPPPGLEAPAPEPSEAAPEAAAAAAGEPHEDGDPPETGASHQSGAEGPGPAPAEVGEGSGSPAAGGVSVGDGERAEADAPAAERPHGGPSLASLDDTVPLPPPHPDPLDGVGADALDEGAPVPPPEPAPSDGDPARAAGGALDDTIPVPPPEPDEPTPADSPVISALGEPTPILPRRPTPPPGEPPAAADACDETAILDVQTVLAMAGAGEATEPPADEPPDDDPALRFPTPPTLQLDDEPTTPAASAEDSDDDEDEDEVVLVGTGIHSSSLMDHLVAAISDSLLVLRSDGALRAANPAACRLLGHTERTLLGLAFDDLLPPELRGKVLADVVGHDGVSFLESEFLARDGRRLPVRLSGSTLFDDETRPVGFLIVAHDLRQGRALANAVRVASRLDVYVNLQQRVAVAANEATTPEAALTVALAEVCALTGWPLGHVYLESIEQPGELVPTDLWHGAERFSAFVESTDKTTYASGVGLPGRVHAARRAVWMSRDAGGPRADAAEAAGIMWGAGFPVLLEGQAAAVLEFFSDQRMEADDKLLEVMEHVGNQLGRVLQRHRADRRLIQRTQDYRDLFARAHDAILIIEAANETVLEANPSACKLYGRSQSELRGHMLDELAADPGVTRGHLRQALEGEVVAFEDVHLRADGEQMTLEVNVSPVSYRNRQAVVAIIRDISQRVRAERALRRSEQRYALAARAANDGLWDWDLDSGEVYYSPRWKTMLGLAEDAGEPSTRLWFDRVHPEDAVRLQWELVHHLEGATDHFASEHRLLHASGEYRWVLARGLAERDEADERSHRIAGSLSDITERKQAEEQLLHDALHDSLTGLPSRVLFNDRLTRAIKRARRHGECHFAVLFLDLDDFKIVNDSLGHRAGDDLLVEIGKRIQSALRSTDTVARLGGDEFAVLVEDIKHVGGATRVAEHIHKQLEQPFALDGREVFAGGAIGIALGNADYERAEEMLRDADTAMYRAKKLGRSRHCVFDKAMHDHALAMLDLETALRKAIENEELAVYFQPIVSLESGELSAFEALVRWPRQNGQLVGPMEFIPLAERTGLIVPLGRWVLERACKDAASWPTPLTVAVNISAQQLWAPDFVKVVSEALQACGLPSDRLKLELTETLLMDNADEASEVLRQLRALGVQLSIDDFGTGYSSLSYLQRFPITTLKIDRSFVRDMAVGESERMIVRTIIELAHSLGLDLVAEGVETSEQRWLLRDLGCEQGQGYLFSQPIAGADAHTLIAEQTSW